MEFLLQLVSLLSSDDKCSTLWMWSSGPRTFTDYAVIALLGEMNSIVFWQTMLDCLVHGAYISILDCVVLTEYIWVIDRFAWIPLLYVHDQVGRE